jgi:hypothetical protein
VVLKDGDGLVEVADFGRAVAWLAEDLPAFELGVRALAGSEELGVGAVDPFWDLGLFLPLTLLAKSRRVECGP